MGGYNKGGERAIALYNSIHNKILLLDVWDGTALNARGETAPL